MIYVITGNPGVGKHTITNELSKSLHVSILDINQIAKDAMLLEPDTESNDVDVKNLKKILHDKLEDSCIIVGHLAPYVIDASKISKAIVLRKNPYELIPIYEKRKYSTKKIKENAGGEALGIIAHDAVATFGGDKTFQIDTTKKTIEDVLKNIQEIIDGKYTTTEVEWLESIVKNNDLSKFFTY